MTLEDDFAARVAGRHDWQKDVVAPAQALNNGTTVLAQDHDSASSAKSEELTVLQLRDPSAAKARLSQLATHRTMVESQVEKLEAASNSEALVELEGAKQRGVDLCEAVTLASNRTFDGESLGGVGSATWRAFWQAARQYSTSEACHEHTFPVVASDAVCELYSPHAMPPTLREAHRRLNEVMDAAFEGGGTRRFREGMTGTPLQAVRRLTR